MCKVHLTVIIGTLIIVHHLNILIFDVLLSGPISARASLARVVDLRVQEESERDVLVWREGCEAEERSIGLGNVGKDGLLKISMQ